jgi:hypothetical protein
MAKNQRTEPFIMLPLKLLASRAWQALGINERRFIEFLMIEHMRHGGQRNGHLLAPRLQLEEFGIGARFISDAIEETEQLGLVDCKRGVGRRPSVYMLTWLPLSNGAPPSNRFLNCDGAADAVLASLKAAKTQKSLKKQPVATGKGRSLQMAAKGKSFCVQREVTKPVATAKGKSQSPKIGGVQREVTYKKILTTAKPKGDGASECASGLAASPSAAPGRAPPMADQPNPGNSNGKDRGATRRTAAAHTRQPASGTPAANGRVGILP